ncbi:hypothetical protein [Hoeflea sp.]|uniref:hypothetical protein n=1 Tax=Hoeflea sp. TaxID=1940281 RepID=UPI003A90F471
MTGEMMNRLSFVEKTADTDLLHERNTLPLAQGNGYRDLGWEKRTGAEAQVSALLRT